MVKFLKAYWFLIGLLAMAVFTLADPTDTVAAFGKWCKAHHGPDAIIFTIFYLSGLILESDQIKSGLNDTRGTLIALGTIFILAPSTASLFAWLPLEKGILLGLFLVATMPTTLSSGVVMTGAAGGNMAHALLITVTANCLSVITIPLTLSLLLSSTGHKIAIQINELSIIYKISLFVILPLILGLLSQKRFSKLNLMHRHYKSLVSNFNQFFVLIIVWMALSQTRETLVHGYAALLIIPLTVIFHGVMLSLIGMIIYFAKIGPGRRESILFMGGQKTLALSILLQSFLFPQFGNTLVFCVMHHIVHLSMDGYLVQRLKPKGNFPITGGDDLF